LIKQIHASRSGEAGLGGVWRGEAGFGSARSGMARYSLFCLGVYDKLVKT